MSACESREESRVTGPRSPGSSRSTSSSLVRALRSCCYCSVALRLRLPFSRCLQHQTGRTFYQLKKLQLKGMSFEPTVAREKWCISQMYSMVHITLTVTVTVTVTVAAAVTVTTIASQTNLRALNRTFRCSVLRTLRSRSTTNPWVSSSCSRTLMANSSSLASATTMANSTNASVLSSSSVTIRFSMPRYPPRARWCLLLAVVSR